MAKRKAPSAKARALKRIVEAAHGKPETPATSTLREVANSLHHIQLGMNLMALGAMLTNVDSTIRQISDAATKCGLIIKFTAVKTDATK